LPLFLSSQGSVRDKILAFGFLLAFLSLFPGIRYFLMRNGQLSDLNCLYFGKDSVGMLAACLAAAVACSVMILKKIIVEIAAIHSPLRFSLTFSYPYFGLFQFDFRHSRPPPSLPPHHQHLQTVFFPDEHKTSDVFWALDTAQSTHTY
jgi:hypothetical protein